MTYNLEEFKSIERFKVNGEFKKVSYLRYLESIGAVKLGKYLANDWHMTVLDPVKYENGNTRIEEFIKYNFGKKMRGELSPTQVDTTF